MKQYPKQKDNGETARALSSGVPFWLIRLITIVATITILWITANFIFYQKTSGQRIYDAYYQPYTNVLKPTEGQADRNYSLAIGAYKDGNYREALTQFEKAIIDDPDNPGLQLYYAICQLELGNTDFAIAGLEQIANVNDSIFASPSNWYLGLAYLRLGQKKKAGQIFTTIKSSYGPYKKKAEEILNRL